MATKNALQAPFLLRLCFSRPLHLYGAFIENIPFFILDVSAVLTDEPSRVSKAIGVRSIVFGAVASRARLHVILLQREMEYSDFHRKRSTTEIYSFCQQERRFRAPFFMGVLAAVVVATLQNDQIMIIRPVNKPVGLINSPGPIPR